MRAAGGAIVSARVVFVHGAGRAGASAWPVQQALDGVVDLVFVERIGFAAGERDRPTDFEEDRRLVVEALGGRAHLVGHSYGAIAALMAAETSPDRVRSVVLFEPACLSLARGKAAVEAHVAAMSGALADASLSDEEFFATFLRSVGREPPSNLLSGTALESIRRLRLQQGPWEASLDPATVCQIPTLVVTSGGSPLSEAVADALEALGAGRLVIPGTGHRPQDDPSANRILQRFWVANGSL